MLCSSFCVCVLDRMAVLPSMALFEVSIPSCSMVMSFLASRSGMIFSLTWFSLYFGVPSPLVVWASCLT